MDSSMGPFSTNGNDSSAKYIVDKAGSHDEAVIIGGAMIGSVFFVAIVGVACMFFKERSRKIKDQQAATKTVQNYPTSFQDARLILDWLLGCHKPSLTTAASNHTSSPTYLNPMQDSSQLRLHIHMRSHSVTGLEPRCQKAISPLSLVFLLEFSNETDPRPVHDPRWAATVHTSQGEAM
ncbi:hypothetical protein BFJ65_g526 [Fusarium oxysporum f. sp. cepae]|uniref:Uncharacterized protein n=1 Tax=Fusarium oxysporum f. sp. cepae TaxID=396571 RepID=A0A3L6P3X5_FUSOX|nr:hypothetical protein BFJ65_g526 [Fusarium oxysporum f. sp. cepae]